MVVSGINTDFIAKGYVLANDLDLGVFDNLTIVNAIQVWPNKFKNVNVKLTNELYVLLLLRS